MPRTALSTLAVALLFTVAQPSGAADWFPVFGDNYEARPTLSVIAGTQDFEDADSDAIVGLELSLVCPTLALEHGTIRQQISLTRYDDNGFEATSFELNPHYLVVQNGNLDIGIGPGIGYVDAETRSRSDGVFALQGGVSVHYRIDALFLGAETRYQWTEDVDFGRRHDNLDNWRAALKLGFNF